MDKLPLKRRHTLAVIGLTGVKKAYLDVPLTEAKALYEQEHGEIDDEHCVMFSFDEKFGCYDAWEDEKRIWTGIQ